MSSGHNAAGSSDTDDCRPPPPPPESCSLDLDDVQSMVFCPGRMINGAMLGSALVY